MSIDFTFIKDGFAKMEIKVPLKSTELTRNLNIVKKDVPITVQELSKRISAVQKFIGVRTRDKIWLFCL